MMVSKGTKESPLPRDKFFRFHINFRRGSPKKDDREGRKTKEGKLLFILKHHVWKRGDMLLTVMVWLTMFKQHVFQGAIFFDM